MSKQPISRAPFPARGQDPQGASTDAEEVGKEATNRRFQLRPTPIEGVMVIERRLIEDQRGWFERLFCTEELQAVTGGKPIVQINRSLTRRRGTVRGLHFQYPPHAEIKIVACLRGEVFDVAVDLRAGSPTFLRWHAERLSAENRRMLVIPEGCAHGFQALTEDCEVLYINTAFYRPDAEGGLHPQDPCLDIPWPLEMVGLSERDRSRPFIDSRFQGICIDLPQSESGGADKGDPKRGQGQVT